MKCVLGPEFCFAFVRNFIHEKSLTSTADSNFAYPMLVTIVICIEIFVSYVSSVTHEFRMR